MTIKTKTLKDLLAFEFTKCLQNEIGEWTFRTLQCRTKIRNDTIANFTHCLSHDYCDANEVMDVACQNLGITVDFQDDDCVNLINAAWSIAKKNNFKL